MQAKYLVKPLVLHLVVVALTVLGSGGSVLGTLAIAENYAAHTPSAADLAFVARNASACTRAIC